MRRNGITLARTDIDALGALADAWEARRDAQRSQGLVRLGYMLEVRDAIAFARHTHQAHWRDGNSNLRRRDYPFTKEDGPTQMKLL